MKCSGGDEEDMIRLHHSVFGRHRGPFDNGEEVPLHSFTGDIRSSPRFAAGDLVDLIQKDDSGLLHPLDGQFDHLVHINKALRFLLNENLPGLGDFDLAPLSA